MRSTDGTAEVDRQYYWRTIDHTTPRGVKMQLINYTAGVAVYGSLGSQRSQWFTHWAPLPTFKD